MEKNEDFNKDRLEEELADVFMYGILLANKNDIDINNIILKKLQRNNEKYPVEKAKGKSNKYDDL
ncbi:hypothetical protein OWR28_17655 [Chryseobacterium sp. 1B4]